MGRIQRRFNQFNISYNERSNGPSISVFLFMTSTSNDVDHKVFIEFDADFSGVHRQHFIEDSRLGYKVFKDQQFEVKSSA